MVECGLGGVGWGGVGWGGVGWGGVGWGGVGWGDVGWGGYECTYINVADNSVEQTCPGLTAATVLAVVDKVGPFSFTNRFCAR